MNYTALDIHNLKIKKSMLGYDEDTVNEIFERVIEDYQEHIRQNNEMRERLAVLNDGVEHYKKMEDSLQKALLLSQQTAEEVKKNAAETAENIIAQAQIKANDIVSNAQQSLEAIRQEYEQMKRQALLFKIQYKNILQSEMMLLDKIEDQEMASTEESEQPERIEVAPAVEPKIEINVEPELQPEPQPEPEPQPQKQVFEQKEANSTVRNEDELFSKPISRLRRLMDEDQQPEAVIARNDSEEMRPPAFDPFIENEN